MLASLRTENEDLRVRVRERDNQLQHVAVPNHRASQTTPVTTHERDRPTRFGRTLALALIIGILVGIIVVMLFAHRR
jgi:LPS O-antigen subunit length determinant protein (WzzB/FepE family)